MIPRREVSYCQVQANPVAALPVSSYHKRGTVVSPIDGSGRISSRSRSMQISRLKPGHVAQYRAVMLQAYTDEPEAFTATVSEREPLPLDWWMSRVSDDPDPQEVVFGAFVDRRLVGVVGLRFEQRKRNMHKAKLFGMFVVREYRARGVGRKLVRAVLEHARSTPGTEVVQLTVTQSNTSAVQLYESCGFTAFGAEPYANKVGDRYVTLLHMWCPVGEDPTIDAP